MQDTKRHYDEVSYFSAAFSDTSVIRLEALAKFLGINAKSAKSARVLELGCAYGGNLFSFVTNFENASAVGIDISQTQISVAKEIANQMELDNISFLQKDINEISDGDLKELGKFDYIIAHGLYSWVNDKTKDKILSLIKKLLDQNGVAYVSYNVYPGWKSLDILRDFMLFVSRDLDLDAEKIELCKQELKFFENYLNFKLQETNDNTLKDTLKLVQTQIRFLKKLMNEKNYYYISHEFLEIFNKPMYFYKFNQHLLKHDLCYVVDSTLSDIFNSVVGVMRFDTHIAKDYKSRADKEQMLDFLFNRSFRKSLITHQIHSKSGEFKLDFSVDSIKDINFALKPHAGDDGLYLQNSKIKSEFTWLYEIFDKIYPKSLSLDEIKTALDSSNINQAYEALMFALSTSNTKISMSKLSKVDYKPNVSRLKVRVCRYLSYFAKTCKPVIMPADTLNFNLDFDCTCAKIALCFDGKNSIQQIVQKAKELGVADADEFVDKIEKRLTEAYFFEEI